MKSGLHGQIAAKTTKRTAIRRLAWAKKHKQKDIGANLSFGLMSPNLRWLVLTAASL